MNYITYTAFGRTQLFYEVVYSIQSFFAMCENLEIYQIVVLTDREQDLNRYLRVLNRCQREKITLLPIAGQQLAKWMGPKLCPGRAKLMALRHLTGLTSDNILMLDTDTYTHQDLKSLFSMISNDSMVLFYREEKSITELYNEKARLLVTYPENAEQNGDALCLFDKIREIHITDDQHQFSSGVIGMNRRHLPFLDDAIELTDWLYHLTGLDESATLGLSLAIENKITVTEAFPYIRHYKTQKYGRFFIGHALSQFVGTDQALFPLLFPYLRLNYEAFQSFKLRIDEMKTFLFLIDIWAKNPSLPLDSLLFDAIMSRIIYNTKQGKQKFKKYAVEFNKIMC